MRTGTDLKITVQDANKKPVEMSLPLLGFGIAFDKAKCINNRMCGPSCPTSYFLACDKDVDGTGTRACPSSAVLSAASRVNPDLR